MACQVQRYWISSVEEGYETNNYYENPSGIVDASPFEENDVSGTVNNNLIQV